MDSLAEETGSPWKMRLHSVTAGWDGIGKRSGKARYSHCFSESCICIYSSWHHLEGVVSVRHVLTVVLAHWFGMPSTSVLVGIVSPGKKKF